MVETCARFGVQGRRTGDPGVVDDGGSRGEEGGERGGASEAVRGEPWGGCECGVGAAGVV